MKVTELKDKILITELDDDKDYICLVNPTLVIGESLKIARGVNQKLRTIPLVFVRDVDKAIKFIATPKDKKNEK